MPTRIANTRCTSANIRSSLVAFALLLAVLLQTTARRPAQT
jgi:hypothetical protein